MSLLTQFYPGPGGGGGTPDYDSLTLAELGSFVGVVTYSGNGGTNSPPITNVSLVGAGGGSYTANVTQFFPAALGANTSNASYQFSLNSGGTGTSNAGPYENIYGFAAQVTVGGGSTINWDGLLVEKVVNIKFREETDGSSINLNWPVVTSLDGVTFALSRGTASTAAFTCNSSPLLANVTNFSYGAVGSSGTVTFEIRGAALTVASIENILFAFDANVANSLGGVTIRLDLGTSAPAASLSPAGAAAVISLGVKGATVILN